MKAWIEGPKRTGPWKVRWREKIGGKWTKFASPTFRDKGEAQEWCDALNRKLAMASAVDRRHPSMAVMELWRRWSASRIADDAISATYSEEVRRTWKALCERNKWITVADITASAVDSWRVDLTKGTHKPLKIIRSLLGWAYDVLHEPIDLAVLRLRPPPARKRAAPPLLTDTQMASIHARADSFGESIGTLMRHLSTFGPRPIDCCRLTVSDWNSQDRALTLRETKNGDDVTHPVDGDMAARLDRLTAGRPGDASLYLNPEGGAWEIDKIGCARQLVEWYVTNIANHVIADPRQRGMYCLKDYAISSMERRGIADRTKALFTGHRTLGVFEHYKTTNLDEARAALDLITAPMGAEPGAQRNSGAKSGGKTPNRRQPESRKSPRKATKRNTA